MTHIANAFKAIRYGDRQTWHTTSEDRIRAVRGFTREQCLDALTTEGLQKTVEQAIQRRLRLLERSPQVAWCWASGLIEIGDAMPADNPDGSGAIQIARGPRHALVRALDALARHGQGLSDGKLLVPGVPEADGGNAAVDALVKWLAWCAHSSHSRSVAWSSGK